MDGFEWTVSEFFPYLFFMFAAILYYTCYGMSTVTLNLSTDAIIAAGSFYKMWNLVSKIYHPQSCKLLDSYSCSIHIRYMHILQ